MDGCLSQLAEELTNFALLLLSLAAFMFSGDAAGCGFRRVGVREEGCVALGFAFVARLFCILPDVLFSLLCLFSSAFPLARPQERLLWLIDLMEVGAAGGRSSERCGCHSRWAASACDVHGGGRRGQSPPGASTHLSHVSSCLVSPNSASPSRGFAGLWVLVLQCGQGSAVNQTQVVPASCLH